MAVATRPASSRRPGPAYRDQHGDRDVDGHHQEAEQPDPADRGQPQRRFHLPLAGPQQAPRPAEALPGADELDRQPARRHDEQRGGDPPRRGRTGQEPAHQPGPRRPQRTQQAGDDEGEHMEVRQQPVVHGQHERASAEPAVVHRPAAGRGRADQQHPRHQRPVREPPQARRREREHGQGPGHDDGAPAPPWGGDPVRRPHLSASLPGGASLQCARRGRSPTGGVGGAWVVSGAGPGTGGRWRPGNAGRIRMPRTGRRDRQKRVFPGVSSRSAERLIRVVLRPGRGAGRG